MSISGLNEMNKIVKGVLGLVLPLFFTSQASSDTQNISMCTEHWPPFVIVKEDTSITQGSWVKLLYTLFNGLPDYHLNIVITPWKRCLLQIERGIIDGTFSLFKKPDRQTYMDFTKPVILDRSVIWYSTKNIPNGLMWNQFSDLTPYSLGVIQGEKYSNKIDKLISQDKFTVQLVTSDIQNFKKLARGRIDLIIKNERVGTALINELNLTKKIKAAKKPAYAKNRYISFTKKKNYSELIALLNSKIEKMKSTGEIRKMLGYSSIK